MTAELPAYIEIRGAAYMLAWSWTGRRIYLLHSMHVDKSRPLAYPAGGPLPDHTVITRERANELNAATLAEFDRTHKPPTTKTRHPDR